MYTTFPLLLFPFSTYLEPSLLWWDPSTSPLGCSWTDPCISPILPIWPLPYPKSRPPGVSQTQNRHSLGRHCEPDPYARLQPCCLSRYSIHIWAKNPDPSTSWRRWYVYWVCTVYLVMHLMKYISFSMKGTTLRIMANSMFVCKYVRERVKICKISACTVLFFFLIQRLWST